MRRARIHRSCCAQHQGRRSGGVVYRAASLGSVGAVCAGSHAAGSRTRRAGGQAQSPQTARCPRRAKHAVGQRYASRCRGRHRARQLEVWYQSTDRAHPLVRTRPNGEALRWARRGCQLRHRGGWAHSEMLTSCRAGRKRRQRHVSALSWSRQTASCASCQAQSLEEVMRQSPRLTVARSSLAGRATPSVLRPLMRIRAWCRAPRRAKCAASRRRVSRQGLRRARYLQDWHQAAGQP